MAIPHDIQQRLTYRTKVWRTSALLLLALSACAETSDSPDAKQALSSPVSLAAPGPDRAGSEVCAAFAAGVCEGIGEENPACSAFQTVSAVLSAEACAAGLQGLQESLYKLAAQRRPCEALVHRLCASFGRKTETCEFVTAQAKQFPVEQCTAMTDQLPQVIADLKHREETLRPLSNELTAEIARGPAPGFGAVHARVTLVAFSDFECPFCARAADVLEKVRQKYGDRVRLVIRQFPLPIHPHAGLAARAALAAQSQGKFWALHTRLFKEQRALSREDLERHAAEIGLDMQHFRQALDDNALVAHVERDIKLGERANVAETPALFVNGQRVGVPTDFDAVVGAIDRAFASSPADELSSRTD